MVARDPLDAGEKQLEALVKEAKSFDDRYKAFTAWVRFQEMKERRKRSAMGQGFDEPGGTTDGDDL
jgi:hypothetical protein